MALLSVGREVVYIFDRLQVAVRGTFGCSGWHLHDGRGQLSCVSWPLVAG